MLAISRVKMRRIVITPIHFNNDTVKFTDSRHDFIVIRNGVANQVSYCPLMNAGNFWPEKRGAKLQAVHRRRDILA